MTSVQPNYFQNSCCLIKPYLQLEKTNKTYQRITQTGAWVHSIGRISNAIRIPFLLLSDVFQIAMLPIRFVISLLAEGIGSLVHGDGWNNTRHYYRLGKLGMNFSGLRDSAINFCKSIDRTCAAAVNVLYAPPKEYHSFGKEMIDICDVGGILTGFSPESIAKAYSNLLSEEGPLTLQCLVKINESSWKPANVMQAREMMMNYPVVQGIIKLESDLKNAISNLKNADMTARSQDEDQLWRKAITELQQKLPDVETLKNTALKAKRSDVPKLKTDFDKLRTEVTRLETQQGIIESDLKNAINNLENADVKARSQDEDQLRQKAITELLQKLIDAERLRSTALQAKCSDMPKLKTDFDKLRAEAMLAQQGIVKLEIDLKNAISNLKNADMKTRSQDEDQLRQKSITQFEQKLIDVETLRRTALQAKCSDDVSKLKTACDKLRAEVTMLVEQLTSDTKAMQEQIQAQLKTMS
jgi:hypothetical protein